MSIMFSSPGFIAMLVVGSIIFLCLVGAIGWVIYHIASGKFHEEYEIATVQKENPSGEDDREEG